MKRMVIGAALIGLCAGPVALAQDVPSDPLLARPLFAPDRRPSGAKPIAAIVNHDPELTGIVLREGARVALFTPDGMHDTAQVARIGDLVNGWRVTAISAAGATIEKNGRAVVLAPKFSPGL